MAIVPPNSLTGLEHMRMSADHNIHPAVRKYLCPLPLKIIRLPGILRSPMYKYDYEITLLLRPFNIIRYFIFIVQEMYHMGIIFRKTDAVRAIGIVKQGKSNTVFYQNFIRMIIRI